MKRTVRKGRRDSKKIPKKKQAKKINLKQYMVLNQKEVNLLYDMTKKTIDILDKAKIDCPSFLSGPDTIFLEINKSESSNEETLKQIRYLEGLP